MVFLDLCPIFFVPMSTAEDPQPHQADDATTPELKPVAATTPATNASNLTAVDATNDVSNDATVDKVPATPATTDAAAPAAAPVTSTEAAGIPENAAEAPAKSGEAEPASEKIPAEEKTDEKIPATTAAVAAGAEKLPTTGVPAAVPATSAATAAHGGRELSQTTLYVGNINKTVTEEVLRDLFTSLGAPIQSLKILNDKNKQGFNYAFVEYDDHAKAENAVRALNGTALNNFALKVTWAYRTQQCRNGDAYTLFVGDLSPEIDDEGLSSAFSKFPSFIQGNVMWDMKSGRSRGYGFVSFQNSQDAETALRTMAGMTLGGRPIRLNWAVRRSQNQNYRGGMGRGGRRGMGGVMGGMRQPMNNPGAGGAPGTGMPPTGMNMLGGAIPANAVNAARGPIVDPQEYEMVLRQAPSWLCAVYLGNLAQYTQQSDLIPLLQNFGYIVNFKIMTDKGYAFVTYDSHERAALAICQLNGFNVNGRPLKCGWGKANKAVRPFNN